jgi:tyrosine-specific transport protein
MKEVLKGKFWPAAFTLSGTIIGAGILGLPYVFSKAGFFTGLFWLVFLGIIVLISFLSLGEVALRTKGIHQLPGLAEKYLGKKGFHLMSLAMLFGIYSALIAYLIGEGESLSQLFFNSGEYSLVMSLLFWFTVTFLLGTGINSLKKLETIGVFGIILLIIFMGAFYFNDISLSNIGNYNLSYFFLPFGVVLFALIGYTAIPVLKRELQTKKNYLKNAIIMGALIPVFIYIIFSFISIGVFGENLSQVATLSFGPLVILLGIFTMWTSYVVLSFAMQESYQYDWKLSKKKIMILANFLPLIFFLVIKYFNILNFVEVLGIGGVLSGGGIAVMSLVMNVISKKNGDRKPEYSIPLNWLGVSILSIIFILGVLTVLYF